MKILLCPLDWGLGHATRCVPLVREMLAQGHECEIGCVGPQRQIFAEEFPGIQLHEAPAYGIRYPRHGWQMPFWLLREMPRLYDLIEKEQRWIEDLCARRGITHIISDNRFGCYSKKKPSVYITHQLRIAFPGPAGLCESLGEFWHGMRQRPYRAVWVPDFPEAPGLSGKLGHGARVPVPMRYLGPLSRFTAPALPPPSPSVKVLALLSGPEPQRSFFEAQSRAALSGLPGSHVLVRGLPGAKVAPEPPSQLRVYNHLPGPELQALIQDSELVLCRSGYSTLMDLACLGARALLIPTPGQTEQAYLARMLASQGQALTHSQRRLDSQSLARALHSLPPPLFHKNHNKLLTEAVASLQAMA